MCTLLIIDASSALCSVAIYKKGEVFHLTQKQPRKQAQVIQPMIDSMLVQANITLADLDGIAYGAGPGSFTGIRIVASITQGLSLALNDLPVYAISSLQSMAQEAFDSQKWTRVITVMNAHMGEVFVGAYYIDNKEIKVISPPNVYGVDKIDVSSMIGKKENVEHWSWVGDGVDELPNDPILKDLTVVPIAKSMVNIAVSAWKEGSFCDVDSQPPIYLRESIAWKKISEQPSLLKKE
jgi:tRNA threonylcarbamoyladenosine biosynthesis protein TsaB